MASASKPQLVVTFGKNIVALDRSDGTHVWHREVDMPFVTALIRLHVGEDQVLALGSRRIIALDPKSGEIVWTTVFEHDASTLLVDDDRIFVGGTGHVTALSRSGEILWHDGFEGMGSGGVSLGVPGKTVSVDLG